MSRSCLGNPVKCETCKGARTVPLNGNMKKLCPHCEGKGYFDLKTLPPEVWETKYKAEYDKVTERLKREKAQHAKEVAERREVRHAKIKATKEAILGHLEREALGLPSTRPKRGRPPKQRPATEVKAPVTGDISDVSRSFNTDDNCLINGTK